MPIDALSALGDNPYFGAGLGLFTIGFAATALRKGSVYASQIMRR